LVLLTQFFNLVIFFSISLMNDTGNIGNYSASEIISRCLKGDQSAQHYLYKTFSPRMFGICLRYAPDYHTAEDLLQEGFIKVFRHLGKYRGEGSFEGWMRRIFVNTSIEYFRKAVHIYPILDDDNHEIDIVDNSCFVDLDYQDLLKMVQNLSPGYRTIFNLYVIEGYSHKEIAKMLEINEGTSKSQLARARLILQKKVLAAQKLPVESVS